MFMPEHVTMDEAKELVRSPRPGAALFAFKRPRYSTMTAKVVNEEPPTKIQRTEDAEPSGESHRFPP